MKSQERINVLGTPVDALLFTELLQRVGTVLTSGQRARIMYVNIHCMNVSWQNPEYRRILNEADVVYCDGAGVLLGARLLCKHLPARMTAADWIDDLCELCVQKGYRLFLLGAEEGIAERAAQVLCQRFPNLQIAGTHHGFFKQDGQQDVIRTINQAEADILLVGMGTPIQELWIDRHADKLNVPIVWAVGAAMDFISGKVPRAPRWMRSCGMEWFFRLIIEPRRMWRRYVVGNVVFMLRIVSRRLRGAESGVT